MSEMWVIKHRHVGTSFGNPYVRFTRFYVPDGRTTAGEYSHFDARHVPLSRATRLNSVVEAERLAFGLGTADYKVVDLADALMDEVTE